MKTMRLILSCLFALAMIPAAWAAPAHVHGEAKLEIVVDGGLLAFCFESPLDGLLGFERAPRTAAEKQAVQTMKATLVDAARLFPLPPEAACKALPPTVASPVFADKAASGISTTMPTTAGSVPNRPRCAPSRPACLPSFHA